MRICHDCSCKEGELHAYGCDVERCPFCGTQLITCGCVYAKLGIDSSPGTWTYSHGLTEEEKQKWLGVLERKGKIPFIVYPGMCARCGKLWPDSFHVPNEEWDHYVEPQKRGGMLCRKCYGEIKRLIDRGRCAETS